MSAGTPKPEILPPLNREGLHDRLGGIGGLFGDTNLDKLSQILDTWFKVPGTNIRFGLDGILGFIPGIGDLAGGVASCIIILAAYVRGVPLVTLLRMVSNVAIEVVVGAVPLLGNFFDIAWRANRRNYHLLERSLLSGRRDKWKDWIFLAFLAAGLLALAMVPFLLLTWLSTVILHSLGWNSLR